MKATTVDKGEGYIMVRFEAENNPEAMILAIVSLSSASQVTLGLISDRSYVGSGTLGADAGGFAQRSRVDFGSFWLPTHEIVG